MAQTCRDDENIKEVKNDIRKKVMMFLLTKEVRKCEGMRTDSGVDTFLKMIWISDDVIYVKHQLT